MKKLPARILKEDSDGSVISSGVFAISAAMIAKLDEKRNEAIREHTQGPYSSTTLPRNAENGYWPIIPLKNFSKKEVGLVRDPTGAQWLSVVVG
jgi:hypothetical protein